MNAKKAFMLSLVAGSLLSANETVNLDTIVTIGTKTQSSIKDLPMQVELIGEEEIQNSGASNVGELLNSTGDIYLNTSGSNGATMSIRGMAHADTLILIDGKRVNGEFSKTYELDRIPTGMVARVEIVKGSSSLLYGSDAMGGVINIITKKPKEALSGDIQAIHGKNKNTLNFNLLGVVDKTSYSFYANYLKRDVFDKQESTDIKVMQAGAETSPSSLVGGGNWATLRSNLNDTYILNRAYQDELELKNVGLKVAHKVGDSLTLRADFGFLKEDKNALYISNMYPTNYIQGGNSIKAKYVPAEQFDKNERKTYGVGVDYKPTSSLSLRYDLSFSQYDKDRKVYTPLWSELGYASKEASLTSANQSTIKHLTNEFLSTYDFDAKNRFTFGAEHRQTDVKSSAYSVDDRKYSGGFLQHQYQLLDKLNLLYGLRYDKDSIGEDATSLSAGVRYQITDTMNVRANYSQGFRSPDDRELYVDQTSPSGKKMLGATVLDTASGKTTVWDLKPETSETYEIGFDTSGEMWNFDITVFQTDIKDRITQIATANYNSFENVSDSRIRGFESSLSLSPLSNFMAKVTYANFDAKNETDNTDLTFTPESLASLTLSYFPLSNIEIRSITKYVGKQKGDEFEQIESYTLTNLKVIYSDVMKDFDLFVGVDNLFRESLPEELGAVDRLNYYAGVRYKF
jgi:outer membrane receptor for ferrienterochelin and colicins